MQRQFCSGALSRVKLKISPKTARAYPVYILGPKRCFTCVHHICF